MKTPKAPRLKPMCSPLDEMDFLELPSLSLLEPLDNISVSI